MGQHGEKLVLLSRGGPQRGLGLLELGRALLTRASSVSLSSASARVLRNRSTNTATFWRRISGLTGLLR